MVEMESLLEKVSSKYDVKLYSKRWQIAFLIAVQIMIARFLMNSIGIVNNVYAAYFDVSLADVDWLTIIQFPGSIIANFFVAFFVYTDRVGLRTLSIYVGFCCIFTCCSFLIASVYPFMYQLLYISEFLLGGCFLTGYTTITQLANYWFPEHEVGTALMFAPLSAGVGAIFAYLIPSNVLQTSPGWLLRRQAVANSTLPHLYNLTKSISWHKDDERTFLIFSGSFLVISVAVFVSILTVVQDYPPTPVTLAQAQLREVKSPRNHELLSPFLTSVLENEENSQNLRNRPGNINSTAYNLCLNMIDFVKELKQILLNSVMFVVCMIAMLRFGFISVQIILFGEITRPIFAKTYENDRDKLSGLALGSYEIAMIIGYLTSVKIMDYFHKHLLSLRLSFLSGSFAFVGTMLGIYFSEIAVLWFFFILVGFALGISEMPLYDTAVQHMYPKKPGLIMALISLVMYSGTIAITQLSRLLLNYVGKLSLMIFSLFLFLSSFSLSCALKPNFKRMKLNSLH